MTLTVAAERAFSLYYRLETQKIMQSFDIYSQNYIDNLQGLYLKHFYYAFYQLKMRTVLSNFQLIT